MWTKMPRAGFEPMILVFERAKTFHALDHAATNKKLSSKQVKNKEELQPISEYVQMDPLKCGADGRKSVFFNRVISLDIQ
jgi:hypothetical protein